MQHLTLESLARLVDEAPLPDEAEHLRDCLVCRRELDAMREQTEILGTLPALDPAPGAWAALESRLLEEGLLRTPAPLAAPQARRMLRIPALRIAAAIALFISGGAAGALALRGMGGPATGGPVATLPPAAVGDPIRTVPTPTALRVEDPAAQPGDVHLASTGRARTANPRPRQQGPRNPAVRQAEQDLAEAEAAYLASLRRYAELADPASGADPETRLEALDRLVEMSARALDRAPDDPQLNGYHLAALNERNVLRRQLRQAAQTNWF